MGTTSRDTAHGSACCSRPSHPPSPSAHSSSSAGQLPGRSHACSRGSWTLRPVRSKDRRRGRAAPQLAGRPFNRRWKPSPQAYPALGASYCPTASTLCMRSSCSWGSGPGCTAGRGPARLSVTSTRSLQRGQRGGGGGGGARATSHFNRSTSLRAVTRVQQPAADEPCDSLHGRHGQVARRHSHSQARERAGRAPLLWDRHAPRPAHVQRFQPLQGAGQAWEGQVKQPLFCDEM